MGDFSTTEKDHLEILWRNRLENIDDGDPLDGTDGATGPAGPAGEVGESGPAGAGLDIHVTNDAEVADALVVLAARGGGNIYMADGQYNRNIEVHTDNVHIIGSGNTVIIPPPGTDGILFNVVNGGSVRNVTISYVTNPGGSESTGVLVRGGRDVVVKDCIIIDSDDSGVSIQYDKYEFYKLSVADQHDLDLTYDICGRNHIVTGCIIQGTREGCGIELAMCNDVICTHNQIYDTAQHGIRILGVHGGIINNNVCMEPGTAWPWGGISIQAFGDGPPIAGVKKFTTNTVVNGNRVRAEVYPMTIFNGCENVIISNNLLESTSYFNSVIYRFNVHDTITPVDYDMKDVSIHDNILIGSRISMYMEGNIEQVSIKGNMLVDYDFIGISCNTLQPSLHATFPEDTSLTDLYIKSNEFKPRDDATQDPKHGIYAITAPGSVCEVYHHGNDHFPLAGYTYHQTTEVTGGVITPVKYNDVQFHENVSTTPYTMGEEDVVYCDATAGDMLVYVPVAASFPGRVIRLKKTDSTDNVVVLFQTLSSIDGDINFILLAQHETVSIHSDGSDWWIL